MAAWRSNSADIFPITTTTFGDTSSAATRTQWGIQASKQSPSGNRKELRKIRIVLINRFILKSQRSVHSRPKSSRSTHCVVLRFPPTTYRTPAHSGGQSSARSDSRQHVSEHRMTALALRGTRSRVKLCRTGFRQPFCSVSEALARTADRSCIPSISCLSPPPNFLPISGAACPNTPERLVRLSSRQSRIGLFVYPFLSP